MPPPGTQYLGMSRKPGGNFSVAPVNSLSGSPRQLESPRTRTTPPAKKRRTRDDSSYTPVRFEEQTEEISDATSDRKSTELGGSQGGSSKTENNLHYGGLVEFNNTEGSPRRSRRRTKVGVQTQDPDARLRRNDSDADELGEDIEATIQPRLGTRGHYTPRAQQFQKSTPRRNSIGDGADEQFRNNERPNRFKLEKKVVRTTQPEDVDNSPDPLHGDTPPSESRQAKYSLKKPPTSISNRGDIRNSLPKSKPKDRSGFQIRSALCQPCYKCFPKKPMGEVSCVLIPSDNGSHLKAFLTPSAENMDNNEGINQPANSWLNIDCSKLQRLQSNENSSFVRMVRAANIGEGTGAITMLECIDSEEATALAKALAASGHVRCCEVEPPKLQLWWDNLEKAVKQKIEGNRIIEKTDISRRSEVREGASSPGANLSRRPEPHLRMGLRSSPREVTKTYLAGDRKPGQSEGSSDSRVARSRQKSPSMDVTAPIPRWSEQKENEGWEKGWDMPLVFNRTTVDKADIPKLDEGECLNDNLIGFGLRYFFDKFTPNPKDLNARAFLLNSFFYEKLKMPGKGRINYDGVKNWTSRADILSYDYIIVPVNEFHHWWVAIICNPGRLAPSASMSSTDDDHQIATPVTTLPDMRATDTAEPFTSMVFEAMDLDAHDSKPPKPSKSPDGATTASMSSLSINSPGEPNQARTGTYERDQRGKTVIDLDPDQAAVDNEPCPGTGTKKRGGRKYNPNSPRIITLDSLGSSHSAACTHLKRYLVAEFKDKRGVDIKDVPASIGMTATNIPQQDNFCDCGIYLLGYIREFVKDPDAFINLILEKKDREWSWTASEMRNELRELIIGLQKEYRESQIDAKKKKMAEKRAKSSVKSPPIPKAGKPEKEPEPKATLDAPPAALSSVMPSVSPSTSSSPDKFSEHEISAILAVDKLGGSVLSSHAILENAPTLIPSIENHGSDEEGCEVIQNDTRPLKRTLGETEQPDSLTEYTQVYTARSNDRQLEMPMSPAKRLRIDTSSNDDLDKKCDGMSSPSRCSPAPKAKRAISTPPFIARVPSPTTINEEAEVNEQLEGEAQNAAEKATTKPQSQGYLAEAFNDPKFLDKIPGSMSPQLPALRHSHSPDWISGLNRSRNHLVVDIPQLPRGVDGEEYNGLIAASSEKREPAARLAPDQGGARDADIIEISSTTTAQPKKSAAACGKRYSAWSSGSDNVIPIGEVRVIRPSSSAAMHSSQPAVTEREKPVARSAQQQNGSISAIDLTGDD